MRGYRSGRPDRYGSACCGCCTRKFFCKGGMYEDYLSYSPVPLRPRRSPWWLCPRPRQRNGLVFAGGPGWPGPFQDSWPKFRLPRPYGPGLKEEFQREVPKGPRPQVPSARVSTWENLRKVNSGKPQFGVVYSAMCTWAATASMKGDTRKYDKVLAVSYLYGAPAQLVVRKGSGITSVKDLAGKNGGSG